MASNGFWLDSTSPEYDYVRYQLTASTSHLGILEKLNIWKINNSELQYRYERRCNGMLKITSWFNAEYLDADNNLEQICMRGFQFDPNHNHGMEFPTGIIRFHDDSYTSLDHCFLLVELGIGRSFVYDGNLAKAQIPQGYDSLYLPEQPLDRNKDGKFSLQEYQSAATFDQRDSSQYNHHYFVADVNQVCPRYIVRFKLQSSKSSTTVIETIQSQLANSPQSINFQQLQYIDPITLLPPEQSEGNTLLSASSPAPNLAAAFNQSLSPAGTMTPGGGFNSTTNNFDTRKFVPIEKLYAQASEEINYLEQDISGQSKHQWIERQLSIIEEKVREINLNYVDILESINRSVEEAKEKLQNYVREKLELCLSIEIELRRQLEQMSWYNNTISYELKKYQHYIVECHYHDSLKKFFMLEFLKLWKQHTLLKNGLNRLKPNELSIISNIHGDLRVNTDVKLSTDPFYASNHQGSQPTSSNSALPLSSPIPTSQETKFFQTVPNPQQDLTTSATVHETVHEFTKRAKNNEVYTMGQTIPMNKHIGGGEGEQQQVGKIFHTSAIQTIIEQEMDTIQDLIQRESAKSHTGLRLPLTISRPFLPNHQPHLPVHSAPTNSNPQHTFNGINMHSLIDLLKSTPVVQENQRKLMNSLASTLESNVSDEKVKTIGDIDDKKLRSSFLDNLPDLLGLGPDANMQNLNLTAAAGEAKKSPPSPKAANAANSTSAVNPAQSKGTKGKSNPSTETPSNPFLNNTAKNIQEFTLSTADKDDLVSRLTVEQLKHFLQNSFPQSSSYLLTEFAKKKQNQLQVKFLVQEAKAHTNSEGGNSFNALKKSRLLLEEERDLILFSLPFFNKLPHLTLIYSTVDHRRDLEELYSKTSKNRNPTLIIIRSGDFRFGAYLNQAPLPTSQWSGNPQCFLFSLSLNLKLPYHGRAGHEVSLTNDDDMTTNSLLLLQEPRAIFGTNDMLMIGNGDLVLDAKLATGRSEIEMSYGIGLAKKPSTIPTSGGGSTNVEVAKSLLAGGASFPISDLEVWTIQY